MPEGHTLHRLATDLVVAFGDRVVGASSPQGRFAVDAARIDGQVLETAWSAGKHLFADFANDVVLHIHLGLYGGIHLGHQPAPWPVGAIRLRLTNDERYADLRGAATCELLTGAGRQKVLDRLGADPLRAEADHTRAHDRIRRSTRPIGSLLMDQSIVSGVGNVYRAETLFRARLHPLTEGRRVSRRRWSAMWSDLVDLMAHGVETGRIDTVRDVHTPEAMGRPVRVDDHGGEVYVYRRTGQPCHVCGATIRTRVLEGRNLFWCPRCQRRR